jgi:hypothetical protein
VAIDSYQECTHFDPVQGMIMGNVHIFSIAAKHTTALYYKKAVTRHYKKEPVYWDAVPDLSQLDPEDILFIVDPITDWPIGLDQLPCLIIGYLIDVHQDLKSRQLFSRFFDVTFIAQKDYVEAFHDAGQNHAYWLPLACDEEIHCQPSVDRIYQVGFVGSLGKFGSTRYNILSAILPRYQSNDYAVQIAPNDMACIYGQSKIVFNASVNGDLNMRVFEALASGALLITDRIENGLNDLFKEGVHYIGYSTIDEAIEKIDFYLAHHEQRQRIAAEGQRTALALNTYNHRFGELIKKAEGLAGLAPVRTYDKARVGCLYAEIYSALRKPMRIPYVMLRYGLNVCTAKNLIQSIFRRINAWIPITPNAIKARFNR